MPLSEIILISMILLTIATLAAGLLRNFSIPYTVLLVVIGMMLSELSLLWEPLSELHEFTLTPELVFFIFLPALIFESGLNLNTRQLLKDLAPVLTLAVPALLISTTLVGFGLWWLLDLELTVALLFGALISATDPVAVVALFKELGAPLRLNVLVEGESLLNDATAIVVFGILLEMVVEGSPVTLGTSFAALLEFIRVFVGGALLGVLLGLVVSEMLSRLHSGVSAILTMSVVTAYGSFILGEHSLHVSGVMATVAAAVTLSVYGLTRITVDVRPVLTETWEFVALVANSMLFLLVGLSINSHILLTHVGEILVVVMVVLLARAATVYPLVPLTTRLFALPRVSLAERHIMWWGGLKGGLAIAIVLSISETMPERDLLINLTLGVVLFTLMVNAWTIRPLMYRLKLDRLSEDEQAELEQGLRHAQGRAFKRLQLYRQLGIISQPLQHKLEKNIDHSFSAVTPHLSASQLRSKVYLLAVRTEFEVIEELYQTGLISQYTLLDIRNRLNLDREKHRARGLAPAPVSVEQPGSLFERFERWILRELREKDWATGWLSHYQRLRANQLIQRNIAGVIMCHAVTETLSTQPDLDTEAVADVLELYRQRLERRRERLDHLRKDFADFYDALERELFTRASLLTARLDAEQAFHQGEINVKAYHRIISIVQQALHSIKTASDDNNHPLLKSIEAIPLFRGLSKPALEMLAQHAHMVTFLDGDIIIGEGEKGDALYSIEQGSAQATHQKGQSAAEVLGELGPGDIFGEMALLGDHVRTATVTATSAITLLRLMRRDVLKVAEQQHEIRQRLEQERDQRLGQVH